MLIVDQDRPWRFRDFFPGWTDFGLMELARVERDEPVIDWFLEAARRSFDALQPEYAGEFATAALIMLEESRSALATMRRVALGHAEESEGFVIPLVDALIDLVPDKDQAKDLRGDANFATTGAALLDAIEAGVRAIKLVRVAKGNWKTVPQGH